MSLRGQLDFQRPFRAEAGELLLYFPFEQGNYFVLPESITLAKGTNGAPDFRLSLVRGIMPGIPPAPYGLISFGLKTEGPLDKAILALQSLPRSANAGLNLAAYQRGFLRWRPMGSLTPVPPELQTPSALRFDGLAVTEWSAILSADAALLLKKAQLEGLLGLNVVVELDISGVAPRLPLLVRFNPHILLDALRRRAEPTGLVPVEAVLAYFRQPFSRQSLEIVGSSDGIPLEEWADTMCDLVRLRYGVLVPADDPMVTGPCLGLAAQASGEVVWDLSVPTLVRRTVCLSLDPVVTASQLARLTDPADFWQEVVVPVLPTGHLPIRIIANLPANRANTLTMGVNITAPSHGAARPQAIHQTVEIAPPADEADTILQLSPAEPLRFRYQPFVILDGPDGVAELLADEQSTAEIAPGVTCQLLLNPADFSVDFIMLEAAPTLLSLARVRVRLEVAEGWAGEWIRLESETPVAALAWPQKSPAPNLRVEATASDTGQMLVLPNFPFQSLRLAPESFTGYGLHDIDVSCKFEDGSKLVAIELLPEDKDDLLGNRSTVFLTPATPRKAWQYFAGSPFKSGFRYRFQTPENTAAWSPVQPFQDPLVIRKSSNL